MKVYFSSLVFTKSFFRWVTVVSKRVYLVSHYIIASPM